MVLPTPYPMSDEATAIAESTAEPDEPRTARAILKKGHEIQIDGHTFTLAMNCVIEGKASDLHAVELTPE